MYMAAVFLSEKWSFGKKKKKIPQVSNGFCSIKCTKKNRV